MTSTEYVSPSQKERQPRLELVQTLSFLFGQYEPDFGRYQWPLENLRWNALALSILETLSSETVAESAGRAMADLDLLAVDKLAQLANSVTKKPLSKRKRLVLGILEEAGFDEEAAIQTLTTLVEAAEIVQRELNGKIQKLLRREGLEILQTVERFFRFSGIDDDAKSRAITRWLQDVINIPVYLETESTKAFCAEQKVTVSDLIAAADELDISVAIVDDLIQKWHQSETVLQKVAEPLGAKDAETPKSTMNAQ
jgi:hypothetical protein